MEKETIEWVPVGELPKGETGYFLIKCIREYSFKDNFHNPSIVTAYFENGHWWSPFFHEDEEPEVTHFARIKGPGR